MQKIYSKLDSNLLLHQIIRFKDIPKGKVQLSNPKEFLQICTMDLQKNETVGAHKHLWKNGETSVITQESWIVIQGSIEGTFYDTDNKIIAEEILHPGDCAITYQGGHSLTNLEKNTIFYEIKTGPYQGRESDKQDINI